MLLNITLRSRACGFTPRVFSRVTLPMPLEVYLLFDVLLELGYHSATGKITDGTYEAADSSEDWQSRWDEVTLIIRPSPTNIWCAACCKIAICQAKSLT